MKSLSSQVKLYRRRKPDIIKYFDKKGYSEDNVTEYACSSMIPLIVIYYYLCEEGVDNTWENVVRLCEFYKTEVDCEI